MWLLKGVSAHQVARCSPLQPQAGRCRGQKDLSIQEYILAIVSMKCFHPQQTVHLTSTGNTSYQHRQYTLPAQAVHSTSTGSTRYQHRHYTVPAQAKHCTSRASTHDQHGQYTEPAQAVHVTSTGQYLSWGVVGGPLVLTCHLLRPGTPEPSSAPAPPPSLLLLCGPPSIATLLSLSLFLLTLLSLFSHS